jgi:N-acetylglucosaminyldiphosphoundecaprenol N-acetyl-beta-D-mannosaminyltransferase
MERRQSHRTLFRKSRRSRERVHALGVDMDLVRPEEVMFHVAASVDAGEPFCVANYNLHGIYLARRNPDFAKFCEMADLIEVDSIPIILFTRLLGLHARQFHRCTYLDWREHFWSLAQREAWRVFYLGGAPGVAETAAENLRTKYPGAVIATRNGYFDATPGSEENAAVVAQIATFAPQILFVGMGMPRQEFWLLNNIDELPPCVTFSVGAAFDYEAGAQRAAPRWIGRIGFEWLYRLACDPSRLFHRYCVEPWALLPVACEDVFNAARKGRLFKGPLAVNTRSASTAP